MSNFLASADIKVFGCIYLFYNAASDWPHTLLHTGCFCSTLTYTSPGF